MLREILYNVPPLYHLDVAKWAEYKEDIARHTAVWSNFSKQAVLREMTDFSYLSEDGLVQSTQYGEYICVIANFRDTAYKHQGSEIPAKSALIVLDAKTTIYTPDVAKVHA